MGRAKYLLLGPVLVLPVFAWAVVAHAQSFKSGSNVTVAAEQTINSTLYAAGRTLDIAGTVNGDVFCAGQNVTVSGTVNGDVICAGQNVTVSGRVSGDVRLAGQEVTLGAKVGGNATVGAQTFVQQSSSTIAGDITVGGQDATLNGSIGRDITGGTNTLTVAGPVGRNIAANLSELRLNSTAKVAGNVRYTSNKELIQDSGATVSGTTVHSTPAAHKNRVHPFVGWLFGLYVYLTAIIAALLLVLLLPRVFEHASRDAQAALGKTFLVGFGGSIIVPLVLLALLVSIVGLPLALIGGLAWFLAVLLAAPFAAYLLGRWIWPGQQQAVLTMLVGSAILFLLYLLPFVGWIFWLVGTWFGLGMLLWQLRRFGRPHYDMRTLAVK